MQKYIRKWLSAFMIVAFVTSIFPILPQSAHAGSPLFFYPSEKKLMDSANADLADMTGVAYKASGSTIDVTGTFRSVNPDSLKVTVENLVKSGNTWTEDPYRKSTKSVMAIDNRFEVAGLQLFVGYNRLTFTGVVNGQDANDVFYVYYEDAPYLKSLKVNAPGSSDPITLNEGAIRVINKPNNDPTYRMMVYMQGVASNTQRVTVNGSVVQTADDGSFFTPPLELIPGENTINLRIENDSNKVEVSRTIYYYDKAKPFIDVKMTHNTSEGPYTLFKNNIPTFTSGTPGAASPAALDVKLLVPHNAVMDLADFTANSNVTASVYGGTNQTLTISNEKETIIYNTRGEKDYRLIEFKANGVTVPGTADGLQTLQLNVDYKSGTLAGKADGMKFNIYRGSVIIEDVNLMEAKTSGTTTTYEEVSNLNNSEVQGSSFFIEVSADKDISGKTLKAQLLPYSTSAITVTRMTIDPGNKTAVYKVENLPTGSQQLQLWFDGSNSRYVANVDFVSKTYIQVEGLYDRQIIEVKSNDSTTMNDREISGKYVGFTTLKDVTLTLNGVTLGDFTADAKDGEFLKYPIKIAKGAGNGLFYGENTLIFRAVNETGSTAQLIEKVIHIFLIDTNEPKLSVLKPLEIPFGGGRPPLNEAIDARLLQIFYDKTLDKYTTKLKDYDLGIKGMGATKVTVSRNGEAMLTLDLNAGGAVETSRKLNAGESFEMTTDFSGTKDMFSLRIRGMHNDDTTSQIYTVELRNETGAKITQKLEVSREVSDIEIRSPIATVGQRIVVNKNFILFDIEAEKADYVLVDGEPATPRSDFADRYTYTYIGLKPDKEQKIDIEVVRGSDTKKQIATVYYTGTVQPGSQFMQRMSNKHTAFNGDLQLTFPKNTVLKTAKVNPNEVPQYYDRNNLLFGIADGSDGVVERMNDYGEIMGTPDSRTNFRSGYIRVDEGMLGFYTNPTKTRQFSSISPVYWISGGLGESRTFGITKPATDGIQPYLEEGGFISPLLTSRKIVPTNRGELTLKFDDNLVDMAGTVVTVFHFNDSGEWVNIGGVVDTKKNTITVPFSDFGYYKVMKLREGFSDVTKHGWARNTLEALFSKGIMENAKYDEFGTDDLITRGEFTTLLVRSLSLPLRYDDNATFFDVFNSPFTLWKYPEIETAARAGIVTGRENRYFGVNEKITREDAATMIARAMDLKVPLNDRNDSKLLENLSKEFTDGSQVSFYALPAVTSVTKEEIMVGMPNPPVEGEKKQTVRFAPKSNLTRAEAGEIIIRIMKDKTKMFPKNF